MEVFFVKDVFFLMCFFNDDFEVMLGNIWYVKISKVEFLVGIFVVEFIGNKIGFFVLNGEVKCELKVNVIFINK